MNRIIYILLIFTNLNCFAQREGQDIRDAIEEAMENREYNKASKMFDHLFTCDLGNDKYALYYDYAFAQYYLTNYNISQEYLNKAIEIGKSNIDFSWVKSKSYFLLASINGQKNDLDKQLSNLLKAIEFEKTSDYLSTIGVVYTKLEKYNDALEVLNEAIEMDKKNAYAFNNRSLVKLKLKMFEDAGTDLKKSLELDNKNAFAYKNKALLHLYLNQNNLACEAYEKAKKLGYNKKDRDLELIEKKCEN